jgi:predicted RNase H-like HicB family nuclease
VLAVTLRISTGWAKLATMSEPLPALVLSDYLEALMESATYEKLEDASFCGTIPACPGVIAFGSRLATCQRELRSTLEEWVLLGLQLQHPLPVLSGMNLNRAPLLEPLEAL